MNVLFPIAGPKLVVEDNLGNIYCKPLIDINGKPLIEHLFLNINSSLAEKNRYIFVVNESDCVTFSLDYVIKLLSPSVIIVKSVGLTQGALCSCLLAMSHIHLDEELLIVNGDQFVDYSMERVLSHFRMKNADGGIITFESIHPKWSYVKIDENGLIVETSEKKPISRDATVGIYYFKRAKDFIEAAKDAIRKGAHVNGNFYVSSAYNEMILKNKTILPYKIPNDKFFPLDTPETIDSFRKRFHNDTRTLK